MKKWFLFIGLALFIGAFGKPVSAKKNPGCAMFLSAIAPGAGQFYNGDNVKGAVCLSMTAVSIGLISYTDVNDYDWNCESWYDKYDEYHCICCAEYIWHDRPLLMQGWTLLAVNWVFSVADAGITCWMRNVKAGYGMNLDMDKKKVKAELTYKF